MVFWAVRMHDDVDPKTIGWTPPDVPAVEPPPVFAGDAAVAFDSIESIVPGTSVLPVIEALAARTKIPISVDTSKAAVMTAAVRAGASMINDVRALRESGALEAAAQTQASICLMHMQGEPRTMQSDPRYGDVVAEVSDFLRERAQACLASGIAKNRLVVDPGIGFGKRLEHNLALLAGLPALTALGWPVLIGVSRKSMFGALLGRSVDERVAGSVAMATAAVLAGASIVRTHDIAATVDAVKVAVALRAAGYSRGV